MGLARDPKSAVGEKVKQKPREESSSKGGGTHKDRALKSDPTIISLRVCTLSLYTNNRWNCSALPVPPPDTCCLSEKHIPPSFTSDVKLFAN